MKQTKLYLILIAAAMMAFAACKKDDDDDGGSTTNQFTVDGTAYTISKGFLEEFGANGNGSFDWDVTAVSNDINYDAVNGELTGTGNGIYLDLNTSSSTGLVNGTYTYSMDRDVLTFVDAVVAVNTDFSNGTGGTVYEVSGGTVTISISGSTYTIDFDLTTTNGKTITGNYTGSLTEI